MLVQCVCQRANKVVTSSRTARILDVVDEILLAFRVYNKAEPKVFFFDAARIHCRFGRFRSAHQRSNYLHACAHTRTPKTRCWNLVFCDVHATVCASIRANRARGFQAMQYHVFFPCLPLESDKLINWPLPDRCVLCGLCRCAWER
jgi:hypothetical protein